MSDVAITVPAAVVEEIAERAAQIVLERQRNGAGEWLTVEEAAEYARCSRQRIYDLRSCGRLPRTGDGSRVLVRRSDLDTYLSGE
jgi:excisionase family DNA binding protein